MAILTIKIDRKKDLGTLKELLNRLGLSYNIDEEEEKYQISKGDLEHLLRARQDFIEGRMTSRSWEEIEKDLQNAFG